MPVPTRRTHALLTATLLAASELSVSLFVLGARMMRFGRSWASCASPSIVCCGSISRIVAWECGDKQTYYLQAKLMEKKRDEKRWSGAIPILRVKLPTTSD